jgi:hypothetical protein
LRQGQVCLLNIDYRDSYLATTTIEAEVVHRQRKHADLISSEYTNKLSKNELRYFRERRDIIVQREQVRDLARGEALSS